MKSYWKRSSDISNCSRLSLRKCFCTIGKLNWSGNWLSIFPTGGVLKPISVPPGALKNRDRTRSHGIHFEVLYYVVSIVCRHRCIQDNRWQGRQSGAISGNTTTNTCCEHNRLPSTLTLITYTTDEYWIKKCFKLQKRESIKKEVVFRPGSVSV